MPTGRCECSLCFSRDADSKIIVEWFGGAPGAERQVIYHRYPRQARRRVKSGVCGGKQFVVAPVVPATRLSCLEAVGEHLGAAWVLVAEYGDDYLHRLGQIEGNTSSSAVASGCVLLRQIMSRLRALPAVARPMASLIKLPPSYRPPATETIVDGPSPAALREDQ